MTALPWVLLASTLTVRLLLARRNRLGWWIDIASVPAWLFYYWTRGDIPLLAVPLVFGWLDAMALRRWWAR